MFTRNNISPFHILVLEEHSHYVPQVPSPSCFFPRAPRTSTVESFTTALKEALAKAKPVQKEQDHSSSSGQRVRKGVLSELRRCLHLKDHQPVQQSSGQPFREARGLRKTFRKCKAFFQPAESTSREDSSSPLATAPSHIGGSFPETPHTAATLSTPQAQAQISNEGFLQAHPSCRMQVAFESVGFYCAPSVRKPGEVPCENNSFWRTYQNHYRTKESGLHWGQRLRTIPGAARLEENGLHAKKLASFDGGVGRDDRTLFSKQRDVKHYTTLIRPKSSDNPPAGMGSVFGDAYKTERYRVSGMEQLFPYPQTAAWALFHENGADFKEFSRKFAVERRARLEKLIEDEKLLRREVDSMEMPSRVDWKVHFGSIGHRIVGSSAVPAFGEGSGFVAPEGCKCSICERGRKNAAAAKAGAAVDVMSVAAPTAAVGMSVAAGVGSSAGEQAPRPHSPPFASSSDDDASGVQTVTANATTERTSASNTAAATTTSISSTAEHPALDVKTSSGPY